MKTPIRGRLATALLTATLMNAVADDIGHEAARRLRKQGEILPLEEIVARVTARWPGQVIETELEHDHGRYVYEIELLGTDGRIREIEYDASTGEVIKFELDD
ncbi:MAG: PepSY domain-containing protein [Gammaproteobacteria bacterium]